MLTRRLLQRQPDLLQPDSFSGGSAEPGGGGDGSASVWSALGERVGAGSGGGASPRAVRAEVDVVHFHRDYLETAALSISAHSHASWCTMRMLVEKLHGGVECRAIDVSSVLDAAELAPATPQDAMEVAAGQGWSFEDLAVRVTERGFGILIGWRRLDEMRPSVHRPKTLNTPALHLGRAKRTGHGGSGLSSHAGGALINPSDKQEKLAWRVCDELLIVR